MDDIDFIEDEIHKVKKAHDRKIGKKTVKVRSTAEKAKDDYKEAKAIHKANIKAIRKDMRHKKAISRNNIKAHKNMIATAKTTYRAIKLGK